MKETDKKRKVREKETENKKKSEGKGNRKKKAYTPCSSDEVRAIGRIRVIIHTMSHHHTYYVTSSYREVGGLRQLLVLADKGVVPRHGLLVGLVYRRAGEGAIIKAGKN